MNTDFMDFGLGIEYPWCLMYVPRVKKIMFNDPATIVFWTDGTKTVVKTTEGDTFVPYYGFLAALAKKIYGSNARVQEIIAPWLPQEEPAVCDGKGECEKCTCEKKEDEQPRKWTRWSFPSRPIETETEDKDGDEKLDELLKLLGLLTFFDHKKEK